MRPKNITRLEWYWLRHWWAFRYSWLSMESWAEWYRYEGNHYTVWMWVATLCFIIAGWAMVFALAG